MKYTFNNKIELFEALSGGDLSGFQPAEKYDVNELEYPVIISAVKSSKTFKIVSQGETSQKSSESEKTSQTSSETSSKGGGLDDEKKFWQKPLFYFGLAALLIIIIAVLVYNDF